MIMKKLIILACSLLAVNAVNAQSAQQQNRTAPARQPAPLAGTAEVHAVKGETKDVMGTATVNHTMLNVVASPAQNTPAGNRSVGNTLKQPSEKEKLSDDKAGNKK